MEIAEDGQPQAWYIYGVGLIGRESADGDYVNYHFDRRGSTVALTDVDGNVTDRYSYSPYGELLTKEGDTPNRFLYNGRDGVMTDPNGLYNMRARYYNPEVKRFVNRDVIRGSIAEGQTLNRYAYVNGNPISYIDPFGLSRDGDDVSFWARAGSLGLDFVPWLGTGKGFQQAFTGNDLITGEQLSTGDRWAEGIGSTVGLIPIPGLKKGATYATKGVISGGSWAWNKAKGLFGYGKEAKAIPGNNPVRLDRPMAGDNVGSRLRGEVKGNPSPEKLLGIEHANMKNPRDALHEKIVLDERLTKKTQKSERRHLTKVEEENSQSASR